MGCKTLVKVAHSEITEPWIITLAARFFWIQGSQIFFVFFVGFVVVVVFVLFQ